MRTGSQKLRQRQPIRKVEIFHHRESTEIFICFFGDPAVFNTARHGSLQGAPANPRLDGC